MTDLPERLTRAAEVAITETRALLLEANNEIKRNLIGYEQAEYAADRLRDKLSAATRDNAALRDRIERLQTTLAECERDRCRLEGERDAIANMLIHPQENESQEIIDGVVPIMWVAITCYAPGLVSEHYCPDRHTAIAAVRRAAGLDAE